MALPQIFVVDSDAATAFARVAVLQKGLTGAAVIDFYRLPRETRGELVRTDTRPLRVYVLAASRQDAAGHWVPDWDQVTAIERGGDVVVLVLKKKVPLPAQFSDVRVYRTNERPEVLCQRVVGAIGSFASVTRPTPPK